MNRRTFLTTLLIATAAPSLVPAAIELRPRPLLLQESPLAGFQYHQGRRIWSRLSEGDPLRLVREPGNRFDPRAVALYWREHKLGYLPRRENVTVAQMLDRGQALAARIVRLREAADPWERVRVEVAA